MNLRNSPDQFAHVLISFDPRREGIVIPPGSKVHLMSSHSRTPWQADPTFRMDVRNGVFTYDGELPTGELEYKFYVEPMGGGASYWFPDGENLRMTVREHSLHERIRTAGQSLSSDILDHIDVSRRSVDRLTAISDSLPGRQDVLDRIQASNAGMKDLIDTHILGQKILDTATKYLLYGDIIDDATTIRIPLFGQKAAPRQIQPELPYQNALELQRRISALKSHQSALSPNEEHYARALLNLFDQHTAYAVETRAQDIKSRFEELATRNGLKAHLSPYSVSTSWAYWDIAKQFYLSQHPQESTSEYRLGNPMNNSQICMDIIHRHLGWELYRQWNNNPESRKYVESAMLKLSPSDRDAALHLLNTPAKANGTLRSIDLAKLGALFNPYA